MKIAVNKSDLVKELGLIQAATGNRTIAILSNVLMQMSGSKLRLTATDLDITIQTEVEAAGSPGETTLPASKIYEIARELPEGSVEIEADAETAALRAGSFKSKMQTMKVSDYPGIPTVNGDGIEVSASDLRTLVDRTKFAVTSEDTRYYLNGAQLVGASAMIATDGHRLAVSKVASMEDQSKAIVPTKALAELSRLLDKYEGTVTIHRGDNFMAFKFEKGRTLISRLIDGNFPAWERVIPANNDKRASFLRATLRHAVARVALVAGRARPIRLELRPGHCVVSATSPEFGDAREEMDVEYAAPDLTLAINPRYLLDFLDAVDSEMVYLEAKDSESQLILRPIPARHEDAARQLHEYIYVLMPMRV
jgi:DNA polymerase-3 subunit beta